LWALEWALHPDETNLRCAGISRVCMPNSSIPAFVAQEALESAFLIRDLSVHPDAEISAFIRTERQTDMARLTLLLILIKNIYTL